MSVVYDSCKLKATVSNSNQERDVFNFMTFCILLSTVTSRTEYRERCTAIRVPLCYRVVTAATRGMLLTTKFKTVKLPYEEQAGGDSRRPLYSACIRVCNHTLKRLLCMTRRKVSKERQLIWKYGSCRQMNKHGRLVFRFLLWKGWKTFFLNQTKMSS